MKREDIKQLIHRYLDGETTDEEKVAVEEWYASVQGPISEKDQDAALERIGANLGGIWQEKRRPRAKIIKLVVWTIAAAAVLLVCIYIYPTSNGPQNNKEYARIVPNDVTAGGNQAILTLSDGENFILNDQQNGLIVHKGETLATKKDSLLDYAKLHADKASASGYNTLSTPKGGSYQVILADGTHVWLNALSSLRYPQRFGAESRVVELEGEGYFEVAHQSVPDGTASVPFIVKSRGTAVQVLGTHFNINSYDDEAAVNTTLLQGSVMFSSAVAKVKLAPGEMAAVRRTDGNMKVFREVDTEGIIAWKNGRFEFKDASIPSILRQLARWYDLEVVYQGEIPKETFDGKVSRKANLTKVLRILSSSGIKFKLEGRKIIVLGKE